MNYDVVILGGGPAGIAAATILSEANVSTVLVEKSSYPREKTCAGILTQKTISFLKKFLCFQNMKEAVSANQVTLMYKRDTMGCISVQYPFVLVERQIFDYKLLDLCRIKGAQIMEGITANQIFPNKNKIILSNSESLTYKCMIVADGAFSPARKQLGLPNVPAAFCIQDILDKSLCPESLRNLQEIQLNFGDVSLGYSWIVPYQERIVIGTGAFTNRTDYPSLLSKHKILCESIGLPNIAKRRGAFVPIGGFDNQTQHPYDNIVLIGDAAGLANPLTGEGIYHALLSGLYAANSYLTDSLNFRKTYLSFMQPILEHLTEQKALVSKFYNPLLLENILFQLKDCPEYLATICDDVISSETRDYHSLIIELEQLLR